MSAWKIVVPHAATNYVLNPSAETTGKYSAYLGATVTRSTTYSARGEYSYKIVPGGAFGGIELDVSKDLTGVSVYVQVYARGITGTLSIEDSSGTHTMTRMQVMGSDWYMYVSPVTNGIGTSFFLLESVNETWYLDCVMVTLAVSGDNPAQTYLDGDQPGCAWSGGNHSSFSTRPVTTRAGGIVYDLLDDYGLHIESIAGDMTRPLNIISERPFRAGGSVDVTRIGTRVLILVGWLITNNVLPLHAQHVALTDILRPDAVPVASDGRPQPVVLQYWGTEKVLQLRAHYGGGLDEMQDAKDCGNQRYPLTFDVVEPYWEEVIERALEFDSSDTATVIMAFGRYDGDWTDMGPVVSVNMGGPNGIQDILETDEYVFYGGNFGSLNGDAAITYLARYNKTTSVWDDIGTPNGQVWRILMGPNGEMYICGEFDTIDAADMGSGVARYNFSTGVWTKVGNSFVSVDNRDMLFDGEGNLYVANDDIVYRNSGGAAWTQIGLQFDNNIYALEISPLTDVSEGRQYIWLYAAGDFTGRLARANLSDAVPTFATFVSTGPVARVYDLEMTPAGVLYLGTNPFRYYREGDAALSWPPDVPNGSVIRCKFDARRNELYVTGDFSRVGDLTLTQNAARYFPSSQTWAPLQFSLNPGTNPFYLTTVHLGLDREYYGGPAPIPGVIPSPRPPLARNLWFAYFNSVLTNPLDSATLTYPATVQVVTANVPGGAESKPVLKFSTDSLATINSIVNRTTGDEIVLNVDIIADDIVFVDLVTLRVWSQYAETGEQKRVITPRPGSRFASFSLLPTGNDIEVRVNSDAGTITGVLRYIQRHHSYRSASVAE